MISDLKKAPLKRWLLPQTSQQLAVQYFLLSGAAIAIAIILAIVLRYELHFPGTQLFRSAELYNIVSEGHGAIALIYALIPFLFAGFGYAFLPELPDFQKLPNRNLGAISFWCLAGALFILIAVYVVLMFDSRIWELYSPSPVKKTYRWAEYFSYISFYLAALSMLLTAINFLHCLVRCERKADISLPVWFLFITSIYVIFVMLSLFVESTFVMWDMQKNNAFDSPRLVGHLTGHISFKLIITLCNLGIMCKIISMATDSKIIFNQANKILSGLLGALILLETILLDKFIFAAITEESIPVDISLAIPLVILVIHTCWIATVLVAKKRDYVPLLWALAFLVIPYSSLIILRSAGMLQQDIALKSTHAYTAFMHMIFYAQAMCVICGALYIYFPKLFERKYVPAIAIAQFVIFIEGIYLTFVPQMLAGKVGMVRMQADYPEAFSSFNNLSSIGSYMLAASFVFLFFVWKYAKPVRDISRAPIQPFSPRAL
ncbi:MAG: cbb3-type cytochrome c oxidase subunit I [Methyloligellaceae bacterium]